MNKLPQAFVDRMAVQLGEELPAFLRTYEEPYQRGIRMNPHKPVDASHLPEGLLESVPWEPSGHYLSMDSKAGAEILHEAGAWYLQEPSAMIPAAVLNAQPGERILDLCAAPGGKTTQNALRMAGQGTIVCNEPIADRARILSRNVERMGVPNAIVVSAWPEKLAAIWPGAFDAIQCDAPCSGEGMFRRHPETRDEWNAESPAGCAKRQGDILDSAAIMLRPGGRLVYSTCTLNTIENEGVVEEFLRRHEDFILEAFELPGLSAPNGMLTIYPHRIKGEGHFVALLQKDDTGERKYYPTNNKRVKLPEEVKEFLGRLRMDIAEERLEIREDRLYLLPENIPDLKGLRVMRSGLLLGEIKKNRFEPSQALACALAMDEYDAVYNMDIEDEDVIRYLKCETIEAKTEVADGFVLVCAGGFPL